MTNKEVARLLKETSDLIELTGGNSFRARAFSGAARRISRMEKSVKQLVETGAITDIQGIGSGLAGQIEEILQRGSFEARDELLEQIPAGLPRVLMVKGLGARKVRALWGELGVETIDDLEEMARIGRIAELDGFGEKTQESILENVAHLRTYMGKLHYAEAVRVSEVYQASLQRITGSEPDLTGAMRRGLNVVDSIDFLVTADQPDAIELSEQFPDRSQTDDIVILSGQTDEGLPVRAHVVPAGRAGSEQFRLTGPHSFVSEWEEIHGPLQHSPDEDAIFDSAGMAPLAPELRDLPGAAGRAASLAELDLITNDDLRGILHNHSTYSDGADTLRTMAEACRSRGFEYFGICDHSQSLRIANGMLPDEVKRQHEEVAALNREYEEEGLDFRVFFGVESDILNDGSLDYESDILELFDIVVASVHQGFNMTTQEATDRIIKAVSNPHTVILGHPTGRLLLKREGYDIDHDAVLEACATYGVSVELNANPWRLDLDWRFIQKAVELGVPVAINPDAHSTDQLDLMQWGVVAARKGGLTAADCLNCMNRRELTDWLDSRE